MKRILAAVVLALLFHALLFIMKPGWFRSNRIVNTKPNAITITMSYKKPVLPLPVKEPPREIKKVKKKEVIKPEKIEKKPVSVRVEEKASAPEPVKEEAVQGKAEAVEKETADETSPDTTDSSPESSTATEGTVSVVITEADPLYSVNPEPRYPRMAQKRGYEGTVLLNVLVSKEGRVKNLWIFESCGYNILDNAAMEAVKDWIFKPGTQDDKPVEMWVQVPVKFELK